MAEKTRATPSVTLRKRPQQRRSEETTAIIIEAAARILETRGFEGFNTNAIAETAGVSIGSLYQYFPGKHALLSALIQREIKPLLTATEALARVSHFRTALRRFIVAAVRYQMKRPELARLIDISERQDVFREQIHSTMSQMTTILEHLLALDDAPPVLRRKAAAADIIGTVKALTDAAGERREGASVQLVRRIEGAVMGYLAATGPR